MADSRFVYVTYIRTTPEKLWRALLDPECTRQYWVATWQECEWKPGAAWKIMAPGEAVIDSGKVVEIEPPRRPWTYLGHFFLSFRLDEPSHRNSHDIDAVSSRPNSLSPERVSFTFDWA
jgi:Activator of Hsp90 ATPase homolog 1-like protein